MPDLLTPSRLAEIRERLRAYFARSNNRKELADWAHDHGPALLSHIAAMREVLESVERWGDAGREGLYCPSCEEWVFDCARGVIDRDRHDPDCRLVAALGRETR